MSTDTRFRFNKKALESASLPPAGSRFTFHDSEVPVTFPRNFVAVQN